MCEHCRNIQTWRKFDAPKDYLACIAYIQQLVSEGEFELMQEESTCPLEKVKTEDGWADEIMAHMIRCKHCGQIFTVWSTPGEAVDTSKKAKHDTEKAVK